MELTYKIAVDGKGFKSAFLAFQYAQSIGKKPWLYCNGTPVAEVFNPEYFTNFN